MLCAVRLQLMGKVATGVRASAAELSASAHVPAAAAAASTSVRASAGASPVKHWVEIDGQCYNVTEFVNKHPGGHVLLFFDHQDATDAFNNFHDKRLLANYAKLIVDRPAGETLKEPEGNSAQVQKMLKEYREWNDSLRKRGLFSPRFGFFLWQIVLALVLFFSTAPLYYYGWVWTSALVCGAANVQFGWLMHDLGHRSVTTSRREDARLNRVFMQLLMGGSAGWWTSKHNRHHLLPNVLDHDPDIHTDPVFVWSSKMKGGIWNSLQAFYFPILGPPVGVLFMNFLVFRYALRHREYINLAWMITYVTAWFYFFGPMHYIAMRVVQGLWFQWVVAVNHFSEHVLDKDEADKKDWVNLVSTTTANITGNWFMNWFTGHLNYQIEHHLFPRMPRCNYPIVAPEARAFFERHNVKYRHYTAWEATRRLFATLHNQQCPAE